MISNYRALALWVGPVLLSACSAQSPPPLEGARIGGSFVLTGEDGQTVRDSDFAGKYRLVYFGYSYCPDACPNDLAGLMRGFAQFEKDAPRKAATVQPIFISIDPERDTPAVLKTFTDAFHPRLLGLTGPAATLATVERDYGIVAAKVPSRSGTAYDFDHSRQAYLMGPDGKPIALIPRVGDAKTIAAEFERWVK